MHLLYITDRACKLLKSGEAYLRTGALGIIEFICERFNHERQPMDLITVLLNSTLVCQDTWMIMRIKLSHDLPDEDTNAFTDVREVPALLRVFRERRGILAMVCAIKALRDVFRADPRCVSAPALRECIPELVKLMHWRMDDLKEQDFSWESLWHVEAELEFEHSVCLLFDEMAQASDALKDCIVQGHAVPEIVRLLASPDLVKVDDNLKLLTHLVAGSVEAQDQLRIADGFFAFRDILEEGDEDVAGLVVGALHAAVRDHPVNVSTVHFGAAVPLDPVTMQTLSNALHFHEGSYSEQCANYLLLAVRNAANL